VDDPELASGEFRMKWLSWLKLGHARKPASPASQSTCPTCGEQMDLVDKSTMSGDDMRTYHCARCNKSHVVNFGIATWKAMSGG